MRGGGFHAAAIAAASVALAIACLWGEARPAHGEELPEFGVRARARPTRLSDVSAPAVIQESPENEASVVRMPDDSLRIFYITRPDGKSLRSVRSTDGGLTWDQDRLEFELPGAAYHAIEVLVDRRGELQATFHIFRGEGRQPGVDRNLDLWHARTSEKMTRWEPPRKIFEGYVGSIRSLIQLKSGRLLQPFARAVPERWTAPPAGEPDYGWHNIVVYYSDDDGTTWSRAPQELQITLCGPNVTRYGAIEPHVIELADGRIWMLIRDRCGRLYQSFSHDGIAWTEPEKSAFISSDSPAWTLRLKDGRLVIFWCACQRWDNPRSYAMGGREVLHAAVSSDEGKSWRGFREVLSEPAEPATRGDRGSAYPTAAETKEGLIALASGQGEGRKAIVLFDPDWLQQQEASDDFSRGLAQWTAYGAAGIRLIEALAGKPARALELRRMAGKAPAGAAWNFPLAAAGEVTLRLRLSGPSAGYTLALTDHFSVIADTKAAEIAVYSLPIDAERRVGSGQLAADKTHEISIRWTGGSQEAQVVLDSQVVARLPRQREAVGGINYLRLVSRSAEAEEGRLIVESVAMKSSPLTTSKRPSSTAETLVLRKVPGPQTAGAVLATGERGAFDADWTTCPTVVHDGRQYRMYYSACYDANMPRGGVGLATSTDGIHWERAHGGQSVLEPGAADAWDGGQVMGPEVHYDGRLYRLWYSGMPTRRHASGIGYYQIGLATSEDGIRFRRVSDRPVLSLGPAGSADEVQAATPSILKEGDTYRMWYAAWSPGHGHTICAARSQDGIRWERENGGQPIAGLQPAGAYGHAVCLTAEGYLLLYMAQRGSGLYAARSQDGTQWTPVNQSRPVLAAGQAGELDDKLVGHPFLLVEKDRIRCWYTGYAAAAGSTLNWKLRIGLAEGETLASAAGE